MQKLKIVHPPGGRMNHSGLPSRQPNPRRHHRMAMRRRFSTSQWVGHPRDVVFAFLADPRNLPALMPKWQKARVKHIELVAPPDPPSAERYTGPIAGDGTRMLITFRLFPLSPVRVHWRAVISGFVWNHRFCDQQQRGPFAFWKHCHYVREESRFGMNGTMVTDEIFYEMGLGAGGAIAHRLFFSRWLEKLFRYRQQRLVELLDAARGQQPSDKVQRMPPARETLARHQPGSRAAP